MRRAVLVLDQVPDPVHIMRAAVVLLIDLDCPLGRRRYLLRWTPERAAADRCPDVHTARWLPPERDAATAR